LEEQGALRVVVDTKLIIAKVDESDVENCKQAVLSE
jgi:hypothetical protein